MMIVIPLGLVLAGCGSSQARHAGPSRTAVEASFRGSPPALVAVHSEANKLLGGGVPAFRARLRALRGHPVVVNMWASWCTDCQAEFAVFQKVAVLDGRRIAFLGLDVHDTRGSAAGWLHRYPLTYPSYFDPGRAIEASLQTLDAIPQTLYFSASGQEEYDHAGPYTSVSTLRRDIRTYLHVV